MKSLLFAVTFIFIVVACQQQKFEMTPITSKSEIVGKWKEEGKTIEIFEDGKIVYTASKKGAPIVGSYQLIDGSIIRGTYEGSETLDYKAYMLKGELILQGVKDGSTARLQKVYE